MDAAAFANTDRPGDDNDSEENEGI